MNVREARGAVERWLAEEVARTPGQVLGAFTWGSTNWLEDDAPFPAGSDFDVAVVLARVDPELHRVRKLPYEGVTVEPNYLSREQLSSAEAVLGDFGIAPNLLAGTVLLDAEGRLARLRAEAAPEYPRRSWIRRRCLGLRDDAARFLGWAEGSDRFLFLVGVVCHVTGHLARMILCADLRNPAGKKALLSARPVLAAYGLAAEHLALLRLVGAAELPDRAMLELASLAYRATEQGCRWHRTPFGGDNTLSPHCLPWLAAGFPALVARGDGRELIGWITLLHTFAMMALRNDAPPEVEVAAWYRYAEALEPLGLRDRAQARARLDACRAMLEHMGEVCDQIIERNERARP